MRTVRGLTLVALSTVLALALVGILGTRTLTPPAGATTPHWQTTASYQPLTNVRAVSCAPSISPSSATCVAVGDDGGQVASIIVTNNGGATWSSSSPPVGVSTLATVSCPSASVCYAGGGSGIMKTSDGGTSWSLQDSTFPAESISCFTIDECTAVGGLRIVQTTDGPTWNPQTAPAGTATLLRVSLFKCDYLCSGRGCQSQIHPSSALKMEATGPHLLSQPSGHVLSAVSCATSIDMRSCLELPRVVALPSLRARVDLTRPGPHLPRSHVAPNSTRLRVQTKRLVSP